jgi:hypothetical protein
MAANYYAAKRAAQGYRSPAQRNACRNCRHRGDDLRDFGHEGLAYDCRLGSFYVAPAGICDHHQPAGIAGLPSSPDKVL